MKDCAVYGHYEDWVSSPSIEATIANHDHGTTRLARYSRRNSGSARTCSRSALFLSLLERTQEILNSRQIERGLRSRRTRRAIPMPPH